MHVAFVFVLLFAIATGVALLARRLKLPYTLALVFVGLALGPTHVVRPPALSQDLLYAVFLPGLLFEAAYHLKFDELRRGMARIFALAPPGGDRGHGHHRDVARRRGARRPGRDSRLRTIVAMTFGVVIASLVVQGLTLSALLWRMRVEA